MVIPVVISSLANTGVALLKAIGIEKIVLLLIKLKRNVLAVLFAVSVLNKRLKTLL
jgi:hypothetical protein